MIEFRKNNHFVPQSYLKRWSSDGLKIWVYRILVPHQNNPVWKRHSIRSIAYHAHLYTMISAGSETDEFERWFEKDFETPAQEALFKATSNHRLSTKEWENLIRFTAAQIVRTPAHLLKNMERWHKVMPELMNSTLQNFVKHLEKGKNKTGLLPKHKNTIKDEILPLRSSIEPSSEPDQSLLKVETIIGRSMWLYNIKHLLTNTVKILLQHKWSILHVSSDVEWLTSDDPVICLNYYRKGSYDFGGGWGRKGSEILFPISPYYMLYTKVGEKSQPRIDLTSECSTGLQRLIAEHSHRWIYAKMPLEKIETLRPRMIDATSFKDELEAWKNWHDEQSTAEQNMNKRNYQTETPNEE
jgi:hypothetical protein